MDRCLRTNFKGQSQDLIQLEAFLIPLNLHILTGISPPGLLTSAALILILSIALLLILLIIPLNLCLFLCKEGQLIEGKLRGSWLGISAGGDLRSKETQLLGRLWISWYNIRLLYRETSAPSALDLIASITGGEKEKEIKKVKKGSTGIAKRGSPDKRTHKEGQDESHPGSVGVGGELEVIEEGDADGMSVRRIRTVLAAMPAFIDLFRDLFRSFHFKTIRCHLQLGLDDPSETAILTGRLWSIAAFLSYLGADIQIEPFFEEERLEGELLAEARMRPIHIPAAIISALREKEMRSLITDAIGWGR